MSLLVKAQREGQTIARVTPLSACWRYVGFAAYRLGPNEVVHVLEASREVCIVVLTGAVDIETPDTKWTSLGSRDSVFEDAAPYAVYLPPNVHGHGACVPRRGDRRGKCACQRRAYPRG